MTDEHVTPEAPEIVEQKPPGAGTYIRNPDGSLVEVHAPTVVPDFAPTE